MTKRARHARSPSPRLDFQDAAALRLVAVTGDQLVREAATAQGGQPILALAEELARFCD